MFSYMKQPLHVLYIPSWYTTSEDPISGIFFQEQALALRQAGAKVSVVYPEARPLTHLSFSLVKKNYFQVSEANENQLPTFRQHGWNLFPKMERLKIWAWVNAAKKLVKKAIREQGRPDLLHAHSAIWGGVAAFEISKEMGIPYVVTEHRDNLLRGNLLGDSKQHLWCEKKMHDVFGNAAYTVAVSKALKSSLEKYISHHSPAIQVIPNLVNSDFFVPTAQELPEQPKRFLAISPLIPSKNLSLLLKAFSEYLKHDSEAFLTIGGDGPERGALEELANGLGVSSKVRFLGKLSRVEVKQALAQADVFLFPTLWETFGVVLIEAMSMGVPIVSTKAGGPEDIVSDNCGKLVEVNDLSAFVKGMVEMKQEYKRYKLSSIRREAVERFSHQQVSRQLMELYHSIREKGI